MTSTGWKRLKEERTKTSHRGNAPTWELTGRRQLIPSVVYHGGGLVLVSPQPLLGSLLIGQGAAWASLLVSAVLIAPLVPHDVVGGLMAGLLLGIMLACLRTPTRN